MQIRSFPRPPRGEGDAPPAEHFRAPEGSEDDGNVRRRKKKPKLEESGPNLWGIRLIVAAAAGAIVLICYIILRFYGEKDSGVVGWRNPDVAVTSLSEEERNSMVLNEDESLHLVKKVLAMRHAADFDGKVRLSGMTVAEAEDFLGHLTEREGAIDRMQWLGPLDANGLHLDAAVVYFASGKVRSRLALLTAGENGVWRFDLAAFVRRNSMDWDEIVKGPACEAEIRAVCGRDSYYNDRYADEHLWSCYRLATPDSETLIFGYCRRGGPEDKAMGRILREAGLARVMVRLKKATVPGNRQCEITSVIAQDWVEGPVPFDRQFRTDEAAKEE